MKKQKKVPSKYEEYEKYQKMFLREQAGILALI